MSSYKEPPISSDSLIEYVDFKSYIVDSKSPKVKSEEVIGGGLIKVVKRLILDFEGREAPFVLKRIEIPKFKNEVSYLKYYRYWKRLRDIGIATLPTMRLEMTDLKVTGILETDLTEGGEKFVFGSHDGEWKESLRQFPHYGNLSEEDLYRVKIQITNWEECGKQAEQIAARAAQFDIYLPFDAYSIVAEPNKDSQSFSARVFVTDLDESFYPTTQIDKTIPFSTHNAESCQTFLESCEEFNVTS